MSDPADYTIAWICAITTEYVSAQAFLDEKHAGPEFVSYNDNTNYTLGKLGKHNVVIGVMPDGEYGLSAATGVVTDIVHSFPNIRVGLMVGIGGGAPSEKHDIRLGDVVVSAPRDGNGGVFQYDFGKTIQGQKFQTTKFLDQPPALLRSAIADLKAEYEGEGHCLEDAIDVILEKKRPQFRQKYGRPDPSSDRLYRSDVVHPFGKEVSCQAVCGDDLSKLITRPDRADDDNEIVIHYGLIASANQLMKDAVIRDRLATERNVLCFEMEAAGLNRFPCLVIRGICDYADSHKNKEWQGYAAMAAAAYAKDLVCRIHPRRIESGKRIKELVSELKIPISRIEASVETILSKSSKEEDRDILDWLTRFQTWIGTKGQTLFCKGIPGAGKTIIAATVIKKLMNEFQNNHEIGIAYIFLVSGGTRSKSRKTFFGQLSSLPSLPEPVRALYKNHKEENTRPLVNDLIKAVQGVAALYSRVFIVFDALDECRSLDGCREQLFAHLFVIQSKVQANVFTTSRPIQDIEAKFQNSLSLEIHATDEDIQRYLTSQIYKLPSFVTHNSDLQNKIKIRITQAVDGMFLLAPLHIGTLAREPTVGHLETALDNLSSGIDETYHQTMIRIEEQGGGLRDLAIKVLSWVFHARRQLNTAELQHALAVQPGTSELDERYIPDLEIIGSICAGMITTDTQSDVIRLVHYTTQEYFERTHTRWFPDATAMIAETCVTYLSYDRFEMASSGIKLLDHLSDVMKDNILSEAKTSSFYQYAACNWGHHTREASDLCPGVIDFLQHEFNATASARALMASSPQYSATTPEWTGLHLAAFFGIEKALEIMLREGVEVNSQDQYHRTPLFWAAGAGYEAAVKVLLEQGAEVNTEDYYYQTPLSWAAEGGYESVVRLLLDNGAKIDAKDSDSQTPLFEAVTGGHEAVVRLLLDRGADINAQDGEGWTPFLEAAWGGHKAVVNLLLDRGVEVNLPGIQRWAPIVEAARGGHEAAVKLLLDRGAQVDAENFGGRTAMSEAARGGHEAVMKMLRDKGAKLNNAERPALSEAAKGGHEGAVKLLLDWGADIDAAYSSKNQEATKVLFGRGTDIKAVGISGLSAVLHAAIGGHEAVIKMLFEHGGPEWCVTQLVHWTGAGFTDHEARMRFKAAAKGGIEAAAKLLIDQAWNSGVEISTNVLQVLQAAANGGIGELSKKLVDITARMRKSENMYFSHP
ncbi:unnamed protein product [Clonostachys solani]|uniref:Nucleoside phosphorylase domain-containing protein n=1 Tax=Clonostachys solani TaxID=160281 RepID=A0A9N9ZFS2_9HYPO|nr:unnamed protein product [Clonostachys solani]